MGFRSMVDERRRTHRFGLLGFGSWCSDEAMEGRRRGGWRLRVVQKG